jgi:hypothetical protein
MTTQEAIEGLITDEMPKERRNAIKAFADLVKGTEGFVVCNCEDCPNCGCGPTTPKKETTP